MPIDTKNKIIFVHIPRTGGTTVTQLLGMNQKENMVHDSPLPYIIPNNKLPQHLTYIEIQNNVPRNFLKEAFSFSFVRNPWDRVLSEFLWRKKTFGSEKIKHLESLKEFIEFVKTKFENKLPYSCLDAHLVTQCSYLFDKNNFIKIDFLGRFEGFCDCTKEILSRFNIETSHIPRLDRDVNMNIFVSKKPKIDYRDYYTYETKSTIEKLYEVDIDTLKYTF